MNDEEPRSGRVAGNTATDAVPENITLRIVILAHGSGREDDLYLVLSLDTTLGELKIRIQESLPQRPPPNQQRIIYQGRGLDDTNEPLRSILRQDQRAGNSSYVLHLVIRQAPPGPQPAPSAPSTISHQTSTSTPLQTRQAQNRVPHVHMPQASPHENHMRIHNQIHQLQHSLQHQQALNRAQFPQALPHFPMAPNMRPDQPRLIRPTIPANIAAGQAQGADQANATPGIGPTQDSATDRGLAAAQTHPLTNVPTATAPGLPHSHIPHLHAMQVPPGLGSPPATNTTQIRTAMDSSGQQTRTVINGGPGGTTTMTFRITGLNPPNPLDRPSSAPGASPSAESAPDNRIVNPVPGNIQIHTPPPPIPMGFPFPPGLQVPFPMPNMPLMYNPSQQPIPQSSGAQPMAWLLSSPSGPQGIVFAPGHGFFNTAPAVAMAPPQPQSTPALVPTATQSGVAAPQQAQLVVRPQAGAVDPPVPQAGARLPPLDLPAAPQPRGHLRRMQARPNANQNEILQFIIARGWLFLRLYMFVFVFSESGTWRRILMIGAIIVYCALPQQNPLTNAFQIVRRHFDNLIGPPNIPQRPPQQGQQNVENRDQAGASRANETSMGSSTSARRRAAAMPTPEETARRLLEQQDRRNPNPVIDALYRIEQGIVLFLASLVPGVGERHVRAREEARRIVQEEEQRRITDAQQQSQSSAGEASSRPPGQSEAQSEARSSSTEGGPLPDGWKTATQLNEERHGQQATSSGVDRDGRTENEGVRSRITNSGG